MKLAYLILSYGDHFSPIELKKYIGYHNVYIHPKYPQEVKSFLKNHIIPELQETKWGDISLVIAEILLLKEAIKNVENDYFILLSNSCYPIVSGDKIYDELKNNNKSMFFFVDKFKVNNVMLHKTSQFWILNRNDANVVIKYYNKYIILLNELFKRIFLFLMKYFF